MMELSSISSMFNMPLIMKCDLLYCYDLLFLQTILPLITLLGISHFKSMPLLVNWLSPRVSQAQLYPWKYCFRVIKNSCYTISDIILNQGIHLPHKKFSLAILFCPFFFIALLLLNKLWISNYIDFDHQCWLWKCDSRVEKIVPFTLLR